MINKLNAEPKVPWLLMVHFILLLVLMPYRTGTADQFATQVVTVGAVSVVNDEISLAVASADEVVRLVQVDLQFQIKYHLKDSARNRNYYNRAEFVIHKEAVGYQSNQWRELSSSSIHIGTWNWLERDRQTKIGYWTSNAIHQKEPVARYRITLKAMSNYKSETMERVFEVSSLNSLYVPSP